MLKNVKSIYILKIIFSFSDEKQKLKLIKYNKSLQTNLSISLKNYQYLSGKYIIYDSNGNGKEYDLADNLLYEGEYLNEKRNGKGREYWIYGLIFEDEYLNEQRNRKRKRKEY